MFERQSWSIFSVDEENVRNVNFTNQRFKLGAAHGTYIRW